jgi:hypothetical protein
VIGIGAGVATLVRDLLTAGSQRVFEQVITEFGKPGGAFSEAAAARPSLQAAFTTVQTEQHPVDFWDVDPDKCPQLADLGFPPNAIAVITHISEAEVNTRLSQRTPQPAPVPVP